MVRAPLVDEAAGGPQAGVAAGNTYRAALLSVYYASLGSRFEVTGAPAVLLPPQVQLLPVPLALDRLSTSRSRLLEALWLLVRATPLKGPDDAPAERYPSVLLKYVSQEQLKKLSELRREYRSGSTLFAAALAACRDRTTEEGRQQVEAVLQALRATLGERQVCISTVTQIVFGQSAPEFIEGLACAEEWDRTRKQIAKIEAEVGLDLHRFVDEFASALAFRHFVSDELGWVPKSKAETMLDVLPVSSAVVQDSTSLQTTATVTTLVSGRFDQLCQAFDPRSWARASDVIRTARFVPDPFPGPDDALDGSEPLGCGYDGVRLLEEEAGFSWGIEEDQHASFRNILAVRHKVTPGADQAGQRIDVAFSLCRSIESTVLWDRRPGGLHVDGGFLKARPLGNGSWRVTSKKTLRFSDRTPWSNRPGWVDFGKLLNYLAPAALTWWLETETYSLGDRPYTGTPEDALSTTT